jgi:hypothetical protein
MKGSMTRKPSSMSPASITTVMIRRSQAAEVKSSMSANLQLIPAVSDTNTVSASSTQVASATWRRSAR